MNEPLRSYDDAAAWLGVPRAWLEEEVRAGRVSHVKLGRHVRFTQTHLDDLVAAREVRASGGASPESSSALTGDLSPVYGKLSPMPYRRRGPVPREAD